MIVGSQLFITYLRHLTSIRLNLLDVGKDIYMKERFIMWNAPGSRLQDTPIIPNALYKPELTSEECEALCTGTCPLNNGLDKNISCPCSKIANDIINGKLNAPINIYYDDNKDVAIFKSGAKEVCVFRHIIEKYPNIQLSSNIIISKFYVDLTPKNIYLLTKGASEEKRGTINAFIQRNKREKNMLENSKNTQFTFPKKYETNQLSYANGKYSVEYDSRWTVLNPDDAYNCEYAYLSYMYHHINGSDVNKEERCSIYFSNNNKLMEVYEEIKSLDSNWNPGTTDYIIEDSRCDNEPRKIVL